MLFCFISTTDKHAMPTQWKKPSKHRSVWLALLMLMTCGPHLAIAQRPHGGLPSGDPESVGLASARLSLIDEAVNAAIQAKEIPGAVVLIARHGEIAYLKAFGHRALLPDPEGMTPDTIFDMASLTKVMATTPIVMMLAERGKLRFDDRVKRYLPQFTSGGKDAITVRQLLTHYSGLRPDFDLGIPWMGREASLVELWKESTHKEPGKEFEYSDLNFIALGEIVQATSGLGLEEFARMELFEPLGMSDTTFNPPSDWRPRIAPTESRARSLQYLKGKATAVEHPEILRGEVHDPTAWRMGGIAGHAGLFSSARDVAIYAQMLINHGRWQGRRFLSPLTVAAMTSPQSPRGSFQLRGFGWDLETSYSSPRGDFLGSGYGHTGFTGTSLWIHPQSETFIVILSNRVHPDGKGDASHLRGAIANIVASSISEP
jgi:CubicO group peptidase (beta-lactamase class C family)